MKKIIIISNAMWKPAEESAIEENIQYENTAWRKVIFSSASKALCRPFMKKAACSGMGNIGGVKALAQNAK